MSKLFVWDLHGTLEKGNDELVWEVSNEALRARGYERQMTWDEALHCAGKKWREYFAHVLPDASEEECKALELLGIDLVDPERGLIEKRITANDYAIEVLERIDSAGHSQIVISNTSPEGIQRFLDAAGLARFFPGENRFPVYPRNGAAKAKVDALREFAENRKFRRTIAIGDSAHDMLGDVNYLYTHPGRKHRDCHAHYKIHDLREILKEL